MSKWSGFYKLSLQERLSKISNEFDFSPDDQAFLVAHQDLIGDTQIENYVYSFGVPTGLLFDLLVDGKKYVVPMATEEPSVIAAANNGARLIRAGEGVQTELKQRLMRGQVILTNIADQAGLADYITEHSTQLIEIANAAKPSIVQRGGGAKEIILEQLDDQRAIVNVLVDPKAAMGANLVNTMTEAVAEHLRNAGYQVVMAILSNLTTEALIQAQVRIPVNVLATKDGLAGEVVAQRIAEASLIEQLSAYRATTANKGFLNGIEAAVLASGNDTRSVNAALHAYAARSGQYQGLVKWSVSADELVGVTELPLMLGVVGGSIGIVPAVQLNHRIMGSPTVERLTGIVAAVGLAQNLAALRALVTSGIQAGHMALQAKSLAVQVGATPDELQRMTERLNQQGKVDEASAKLLLEEIRGGK
ncbi:MAG: hydroxymethylglutaryl-CoA reductase, degradative [Lactobacillaceae bacterium]|jgi:hydroxymethylglutaryl-CoA reductase|nr:hydroxymethylglutaryl-CoA reductase, degradative [Lactobacillaceae bacterium]